MTPVYIKVVFTLILLVTITLFTLKAPETPIFIVKYPGLNHKTQKSSFPKINKNYTENHSKSLPQIVHNTGIDGGITRYLESVGSSESLEKFRIDGKSSEDSGKVYIQK